MVRHVWLSALMILCRGGTASGQTECGGVRFPAGFVPFTSVYYAIGTSGQRQVVVGSPGPGGISVIRARMPALSAWDQRFGDSWIELAPGRFYWGVFVPSPGELSGDYYPSRFPERPALFNPVTNDYFPFNLIPSTWRNDVFAFWVMGSQTTSTEPPAIAENGMVSATGDRGPYIAAPGALVSIFGTNLASRARKAPVSASGRLPVLLEDASVRIGGKYAPLLYVSPGQINAPAVFYGAFLKNADFSTVSEENPARPGDLLLVYCTGLGAVRPTVGSGVLAPANPLALTVAPPGLPSAESRPACCTHFCRRASWACTRSERL